MEKSSDPLLLFAANAGPLTGSGNNTWLIDGDEPTLVDAGVGKREHLDALARALGGRRLVRVLLTHGHPDHAAGLPALMARWPELEACKFPLTGETPGRALADGDMVRAGDRELRVVHTPGHAPDHVCFVDTITTDLYAGDMLTSGTTVMIPAGRGGNLRQYLASLERLAGLGPRRVYPGHGPIIERPLALITEYIEHRRLRERQIRACLADGVSEVDAIVRRVYPDLPEPLRHAAALTVEAHLEKLREDGPL